MSSDKKSKRDKILSGNDMHYPGQTNHDACYVPECVRQYSCEPLYILVARWCQQQKDWVQRNQISEAFRITPRRASYLISYLRNKASRVVCVCRYQTLPNKAQRYEIYVVRVLENTAPVRRERAVTPSPVSRRRVGNGDRTQANELWNRLRSNRHAGKILKKEDENGGV
ncbi:CaiF/GrlA family transcriptional regulator [Salmonella enterica]|nr:CaiF/GrlA family transcriptional regulator [Salmonella enterica]EJC8751204.1 CaiF/GrlA family transcriptional regulator [Salmonella enterica]HCM1648364.1 CaiF/GrlA family transcriptional regulator [Salmonella enterica subsp. diarizonae serovar 48:i:z35]